MNHPVTELVSDRESLPRGQPGAVHCNERTVALTYDACSTAVQSLLRDEGPIIVRDRFDVDLGRRLDRQVFEDLLD